MYRIGLYLCGALLLLAGTFAAADAQNLAIPTPNDPIHRLWNEMALRFDSNGAGPVTVRFYGPSAGTPRVVRRIRVETNSGNYDIDEFPVILGLDDVTQTWVDEWPRLPSTEITLNIPFLQKEGKSSPIQKVAVFRITGLRNHTVDILQF